MMTMKLIDELGSDKVSYTAFPDPLFGHDSFLLGYNDNNIARVLLYELFADSYETDSAYALTTVSAIIVAISAMSF